MAMARKLPSGNWNVEAYDYTDKDGKKKKASFTAPTKALAELMGAEFRESKKRRGSSEGMIVQDAVDIYIKLSAVLSPTTTNGYEHALTDAFPDLLKMKVRDLTNAKVQKEINKESRRITRRGKKISAKTVKNEWGLISPALKTVCGMTFEVKLPTYRRKQKHLPPVSDVLKAIKGTNIELPCLLAMWRSLRASEIRGLMYSDMKDDIITINRVKVDAGEEVVKDYAKTDTSHRSFPVPQYIKMLIYEDPRYMNYLMTGEDDYICPHSHMQLHDPWEKICKENGFDMTFHDLRAMNASILLNILKMPDKVVQKEGGWKTDNVMKTVYSVAFDETMLAMFSDMDEFMYSQME